MSGMFWIALEMSIPKIGLNVMLSLTVKKLDAFKFDGVGESNNTAENSPTLDDRGTVSGHGPSDTHTKVQSGVHTQRIPCRSV